MEHIIRKLSKNDTGNFIKGFNETFPNSISESHFLWQYFQNPFGDAEGLGVFDGDALIAHYGIIPIPFKIREFEGLGARSIDGFTHPAAQGQGLFKTVGQATYEHLRQNTEMKIVYGFSNSNSVHGVYKYLGRIPLDPVPFLFRFLHTSYINRKLHLTEALSFPLPPLPVFSRGKSRKIVSEINGIPEDIDDLWNSFKSSFRCGIIRNKKFLKWRYADKPSSNYRFFECRDSEGTIHGLVIVNILEKHGGKLCYIMELLCKDNDSTSPALILRSLYNVACDSGVEVLVAWMMEHHFLRRTFILQGFHPIPRRFWPTPMHLGINILDEEKSLLLSDRKNWFISYSDSDTL